MRAPAMAAAAQTTNASPRNRAERRGHTRLSAAVSALLRRFDAALSPDERARLEREVTDARARTLGRAYSARAVVRELVRLINQLAPYLLKGQLPPYGPLRVRYALDLARAMLPTLTEHAGVDAASETVGSDDAPVPLRPADRRRAMTALVKHTSDPQAKAAIESSLDERAIHTARTREQERTLARIEKVRAAIPARLRDDMGLTDETLAALENDVLATLDKQQSRRDAQRAKQTLRADMIVPCGRLVAEIRELVAAARDHHADNPAIPAVASALAPARRRAPKAAGPAPTPAPPIEG